MHLLPSIFSPPIPKALLSVLSNPRLISCNYHDFSVSILETLTHPSHFNQVLSHAIASGRFAQPCVSRKLLDYSLSCSGHAFDFSRTLFFQIPKPDTFAWNLILRACHRSSSPAESITFYNLMLSRGALPNNYTFHFVLQACGRLSTLEKGQELHCSSVKLGFEFDVFVQNVLMSMYLQCSVLDYARRVFDMVPGLVRDLVTWNTMISGYVQNDCFSEALVMFGELLADGGLRPNGVTMVSAVKACGRIGLLDLGRKIHGFSIAGGFVDVFLGSSLIDMYAKCGLLEDARKVFDGSPERNIYSWTCMIGGYVQSDLFKEAIELFRQTQLVGVKADLPTVACVLSACAHLGALDLGEWVHGYCERNGMELNLTVKNSLIDMYSKCGNIEKALEIFDGLFKRDVISWTVMISGLAMNGYSDQALQLFSQMEMLSDVRPNEVTFLGVLCACSHGGFVEKGHFYFDAMTQRYGLTPQLEHYGCMVDLLGRANLLVEAEMFIRSMPVKPDAVIWRSLLCACTSHGNIELAEVAANQIEDLEVGNCGARVLLSNIYASALRWGDAKSIREHMVYQGIQKQPACCFIEINGFVHSFLVSDDSHNQIDLIRENIVEIHKVLKFEGFDLDILDCQH